MSKPKNQEMRDEYDFSKMRQVGPRGKYAQKYKEATNVVVIDDDLSKKFPTAKSVNDALRKVLKQQDNSAA